MHCLCSTSCIHTIRGRRMNGKWEYIHPSHSRELGIYSPLSHSNQVYILLRIKTTYLFILSINLTLFSFPRGNNLHTPLHTLQTISTFILNGCKHCSRVKELSGGWTWGEEWGWRGRRWKGEEWGGGDAFWGCFLLNSCQKFDIIHMHEIICPENPLKTMVTLLIHELGIWISFPQSFFRTSCLISGAGLLPTSSFSPYLEFRNIIHVTNNYIC